MNKHIFLLGGMLVAQLLFATVVNQAGEDYGTINAEEPLLVFDKSTVDGVRIEGATDTVVLHRKAGQWFLPEHGDSQVNLHRVEQLLDALAGLKKGWPVAKTQNAAQRFNVAENQFEQKISLLSGGEVEATLFIGSSPGFRKVYVRQGHAGEVFAVAFDTWMAVVKTDDWVDQAHL